MNKTHWLIRRSFHPGSPRADAAVAIADGRGHAREVATLQQLHDERGLDVVRLNPGFVYGPGGLLKTALVDQARRSRLRCIEPGRNWWSCVHVEDLGRAYAAALTTAAPGSYYAVADSELDWHPAHPSFRLAGPAAVTALLSPP